MTIKIEKEKLEIFNSFNIIYQNLIKLLDFYDLKVHSRKKFKEKKEDLENLFKDLHRLFSKIELNLRIINKKLNDSENEDIRIKSILSKKLLKNIIEFDKEKLKEYKKIKRENEYLAHLLIWIKIFEERIKRLEQAILLINEKSSQKDLEKIIKNTITFYNQINSIKQLFYDKAFFNGSPDIKLKQINNEEKLQE